jgi:plasmid maintenance system killer protein
VLRYALQPGMIKTFQHKGLNAFFETGSMAEIQPVYAPRLAAMLRRLNEVLRIPANVTSDSGERDRCA